MNATARDDESAPGLASERAGTRRAPAERAPAERAPAERAPSPRPPPLARPGGAWGRWPWALRAGLLLLAGQAAGLGLGRAPGAAALALGAGAVLLLPGLLLGGRAPRGPVLDEPRHGGPRHGGPRLGGPRFGGPPPAIRRPLRRRATAGLLLGLGLVLCSAGRSGLAARVEHRLQGLGPETRVEPARRWIEGRWVQRGRAELGRGWLDLGPGRSLPWLLVCEGPAPEAGERVALWGAGETADYAAVLGLAAPDGLRGERRVHPDELQRLGHDRGWLGDPQRRTLAPLRTALGELRARLAERLARARAASASGLGPALLWGDRQALDRELQDLFTRTGTRHLLALSGLHVGLIAALLLLPARELLARALRRGPRAWAVRAEGLSTLAALGALLGFVALSGAAAPVQRASLALGAVLAAPRLPAPRGALPGVGRRARSLPLIGLALLLEALGDPLAVADVSLQLSYGATAAILVAALPAARRLAPRAMAHEGPQLERAWLRGRAAVLLAVLRLRGARFLALGLGASCAAQLATLPTSIATFGELAPLGGLLTLGATPLVAGLLPALALAAALPHPLVGAPARWLEAALVGWLELGDRLPGTPWLVPERPFALLLLLALLGLHALARGFGWSARGAGLLAAALLVPWRGAPRDLRIDLIDGGHGTACVLELPGGELWLFDGGTRDTPGLIGRAYRPLLRRRDPARVHLALSHTDRDHWSALPWVARRVPLASAAGVLPEGLLEALDSDVPQVPGPVDGGRWPLPRTPAGVRLELLGGGGASDNEGSTTLVVRFAGRELVLSGDAVDDGLAELLASGHLPASPDLLLMPHHGSFGSAVPELLERMRPGRVWIAAGRDAPIEPELRRRGQPYWSTPRDGPLGLVVRPSGTLIWRSGRSLGNSGARAP